MKMSDLLERAKNELQEERETMATERIKERLKEIHEAKKVLSTMEKQLEEMMQENVNDLF